ncbi:MAG: peptidoglycan DD-metalloendopeptidase family protein [Oscillospiraceae bacterium]|nr:peptidoglycan DD-metalloendopeptidase family protein [Oscillospiraceae bacterium]
MKNQNWRVNIAFTRFFSMLLALALLFTAVWIPSGAAQTKEELEREKQKVEERIQENEKQLQQLKDDKAAQERLIPALEAQIEEISAKMQLIDEELKRLDSSIAALQLKIEQMNREIADCREQIRIIEIETADKEAVIDRMQQQLIERLRQQYMNGPVSNLQLLLSSSDLTGFLTMAEYISRTARRDAELRGALEQEMRDMLRLKEELNAQTESLQTKLAQVEQESAALERERGEQRKVKKDLSAEHERISVAQSEVYAIIRSLKSLTADAERMLAKDRKAVEEFERKLDDLLREKKAENSDMFMQSSDGTMRWPVPYPECYISSRFGDTSNRSHVHKGLDISAPGANQKDYQIIAALEGVVLDYGFDNSMGYYVVLHHGVYKPKGKEIKTTYMHLRSFSDAVKTGARIPQGKILGVMGSTGNSTGAHLHFQINEIAANGNSVAVDPLTYIKNPY